jgi:hypothetical protein
MLSLKNKYSPAIAIVFLAFAIFIFSCKKDKEVIKAYKKSKKAEEIRYKS